MIAAQRPNVLFMTLGAGSPPGAVLCLPTWGFALLGMVFTEFIDMVEVSFSADVVDELLEDQSDILASGGAYTAVGNYDHAEMLVLVHRLAGITGHSEAELIYRYGKHLFTRFHRRYPVFFRDVDDTFGFLESVHGHIHVEVRKLYADARPPSLHCRREDGSMIVDYRSDRPFAPLAHGLIDGCIAHFGEAIVVRLLADDPTGRSATFRLDRREVRVSFAALPVAANEAGSRLDA